MYYLYYKSFLSFRNQQTQPSKSFYFGMDKDGLVPEEEEMGVHEKVRRHLEMSYNSFPKTNGYQKEEKPVKITAKNGYDTRLELPPGIFYFSQFDFSIRQA